jgi:hypothetical protein
MIRKAEAAINRRWYSKPSPFCVPVHGFWLINWIRNASRTEIKEIYQKLGDLVADGSLSAAVEHVYPLNQFREAFKQSLKRKNRTHYWWD